ncbi:MAG: hypothetical protein EBX41_04210 [Chitinophagia bacterium]|nr:hypothetical protein [Chitinophagia bacterium]
MFLHFFFILLYVLFTGNGGSDVVNYLLVLHCGICLVRHVFTSDQIMSPIVVYYIAVGLTSLGNVLVVKNVALGLNTSYAFILFKYIDDGSLLWAVGCSFIFIGYEAFSKKSFPAFTFNLSKKNARAFFMFSLIVGIFYPFIASSLSFLGSLLKLLYLSGTIGVLFFSRLWGAENDKTYMIYAITLHIVQTILAIYVAYLRFELIIPTIVLFIGYAVGKRKIGALVSPDMLPFIFVSIIFVNIFSTLGNYRANFSVALEKEYFSEQKEGDYVMEGITMDESEGEVDEVDKQQSLTERLAVIAQTSNIVGLTESKGFYDGLAITPVLVALIPRFLWPDKPAIRLGAWFAVEIGAAYVDDQGSINNSINMTIPGHFYLDFGWFGLVIGCFFFGGYISALWNSVNFYTSNYNFLGTLYGGYLLLYSFYGPAGDLQIVVTFLSVYLIFITLNWFLPKIIKN